MSEGEASTTELVCAIDAVLKEQDAASALSALIAYLFMLGTSPTALQPEGRKLLVIMLNDCLRSIMTAAGISEKDLSAMLLERSTQPVVSALD